MSAAYARIVTNSFVTVEGEGVGMADDGSIHFPDMDDSGPVTVTARPGWRVNGRKSLSLTRAQAAEEPLTVTSELGEDSEEVESHECDFKPSSKDVHGLTFEVGAEAAQPKVVAMYALPATSAVVTASASSELLSWGDHTNVTTYSKCECGLVHDPEAEYSAYGVCPDRYEWTAKGPGLTLASSTWSGPVSKGLGQEIQFKVTGKRDACSECRSTAETDVVADVYELSIARPVFLGLDRTDAGWANPLANACVGTAKIDPEPSGEVSYSWTDCGICSFIDPTDQATVQYYQPDLNSASGSHLAEPLTVKATVSSNGQTASATCTTNFTVVKVDISLPEVDEEGDETALPPVEYVADDVQGSLSKTGLRSLHRVAVSCAPTDIPGAVKVAVSSGAKLYETTVDKDGNVVSAVPAQPSYPCSEIGEKMFGIHGHSVSVLDVGELMTAVHDLSGARDHARVKVVPPPPLEVTVDFKSPAKGGGWPYDPVWDDPEWKPTVDGSLAEQCAEDTDDALVIYSLSRDAGNVRGEVYATSPWPDKMVDTFAGTSSEGVHTNFWAIGPTRPVDDYYVKVFATEKGTERIRDAKSSEGRVRRESYYCSDSVCDPHPVSASSRVTVTFTESLGPMARRVTVDLCVAYLASEVVAARVAAWALKYGFSNAKTLSFATGFSVSESFSISGSVGIDEKWGTQRALYSWNVTRYDWIGSKYMQHSKWNPNYNTNSNGQRPIAGPYQLERFPSEFVISTEKYRRVDNGETTEKTVYKSYEKGEDEGNENPVNWRWEASPYGGGYGMSCPSLQAPNWN